MSALENTTTGDLVTVDDPQGLGRIKIQRVVRTTATQVIIVSRGAAEVRYSRKTGRRVGAGSAGGRGWSSPEILRPITPADVVNVRRQQAASAATALAAVLKPEPARVADDYTEEAAAEALEDVLEAMKAVRDAEERAREEGIA